MIHAFEAFAALFQKEGIVLTVAVLGGSQFGLILPQGFQRILVHQLMQVIAAGARPVQQGFGSQG